MPFDQPTRNALAKMVGDCRRLLTEDVRKQLQGIYGLQPDGTALSLDALGHLNEQGREIARELREWQAHLAANEVGSETKRRAAAFERIVRETSFTVLNRLAALRLCEERGHVIECVRRGMASDGFQLFERLSGGALGPRGETYKTFLDRMFDELAIDLGVFDLRDPRSLVFPDEQCLEQVLALLTAPALAHLWQEDETIGWIYQYFNDPAERKKMREQSPAPRNSYELAVRNQFFTPRYVVEFLTDNTLGRIWYEMTCGETRLKDQCRYLVRRPNEVFLASGEEPPAESGQLPVASGQPKDGSSPTTDHRSLTTEELLKQPVHIPHRPVKDPRTILMLDPACGSMHFGLYAFDLFEVIYDEAWELEEKLGASALSRPPGMKCLHDTYAAKDTFLKDVPRLIIERNIHGIDIDPRCAQIAGLSLWLRAQKSWQRLGAKAAEIPSIRRSNIVCAEPMPGEKELLREFIEREFPAAERGVFLRLLEAIFDKMQLAGEAGSLLKIEEEIRSGIAEAKKLWKEGPKDEQAWLFPGAAPAEPKQMKLDLSGITDEQFWDRAEDRIYAALRDYAEQAENGGGFQRRLFAEDAARGFAFIDVCRKRYDIAVMNPPFGLPTKESKSFLIEAYEETWKDIYAAFGERALGITHRTGFFGAITPSTWQYSRQLRAFRCSLLDNGSPVLLAELGSGVMDDAAVQASIWTASPLPNSGYMLSLDLLGRSPKSRAEALLRPHAAWRATLPSQFQLIAETPYCHHLALELLDRWRKGGRLHEFAQIAKGNTTFDDFRFLRFWPEVPGHSAEEWKVYRSGGDFQPFFAASVLKIFWADDGKAARAFGASKHGSDAQVMQSSDLWYKAGLAYPRVGTLGFGLRVAKAGEIFSGHSVLVLPRNPEDSFLLLTLLNSSSALALFEAHGRHRLTETIALKDLPVCPPDLDCIRAPLEKLGRDGFDCVSRWESGDETSPLFAGMSVRLDLKRASERATDFHTKVVETAVQSSKLIQTTLNLDRLHLAEPDSVNWKPVMPPSEATARLLSWLVGSSLGRWDIRYATGERPSPELPDPFAPLPVSPPGMLQDPQGLPAGLQDTPASYPICIPWDGILVDDPNHPLDLERRAREIVDIVWKDRAEAIEREACEILGLRTLRDYFRKPSGFFADHLKRYSKSRRQAPIYWPLSTASGGYTLWIYCHRLTDQTLYACVNDFVQPKLNDLERDIPRLRDEKRTGELQAAVALQGELEDFKQELLAWAPHWKPNLNDGVLITACPLWKLFRLPKWRKDLEACWKELEAGEYDWAHLACSLWPDRVREKCKKDRSIAIAHGLEEICEVEPPETKGSRRGRKAPKTGAKQMELDTEEIGEEA